MGQFSWIYSDTNKQMVDDKIADSYLLVPNEFQWKYGKAIKETCYRGYGMFGKYDVYDLIPEWNKEMIPEIIEKIRNGEWKATESEYGLEQLRRYYDGLDIDIPLRYLGITMAYYDEDNESLKYPIKIATEPLYYNDVSASKGDPDQGWEYLDDEDDPWYEGYWD